MASEISIVNNSERVLDTAFNSLPREFFVVSKYSWIVIVISSIIFCTGICGNVYAIVSLQKRLRSTNNCSIHKLLLHIFYTELLVVIITIPLEIGWRFTIGWYAGIYSCKTANFIRCFIYFLSSLILICTSCDCFFNIFCPIKTVQYNAGKRVRFMVITSWVVAFISATPKFYLSFVQTNPVYPTFKQCLLQPADPFFSIYPLIESYFAPLVIVIITYIPTFFRLCHCLDTVISEERGSSNVRLSSNFQLIQVEGVKLSFAFALVSIICYTPQITLILWHTMCPTFLPSSTQELFVYVIESSKSVALPVAYKVFKRQDL